ncbi:MAG: hypothetical protein IPM32_09310 [Ignavibacteriae bacterium]|nr:hypothetical protein [Ignavibacteriota bacterium]
MEYILFDDFYETQYEEYFEVLYLRFEIDKQNLKIENKRFTYHKGHRNLNHLDTLEGELESHIINSFRQNSNISEITICKIYNDFKLKFINEYINYIEKDKLEYPNNNDHPLLLKQFYELKNNFLEWYSRNQLIPLSYNEKISNSNHGKLSYRVIELAETLNLEKYKTVPSKKLEEIFEIVKKERLTTPQTSIKTIRRILQRHDYSKTNR